MRTANGLAVSVVLPFFNAASWLESSLRSLRAQSLGSVEIIAIDDGSVDGSEDLALRAIDRGLPMRLIKNERNLGIVASLNRGLDEASGRFIARMDADDICLSGRLARQIAFLDQTGLDVCGTWFVEFGQGIPRTVRWPHSEPGLRAAMLFQNTLCHPTVMARREVFDRYRYREEYRLVEDYDLFGRALAEFRMANVPEPLLRYRRHPQQVTQAKRDAMEAVTKCIRLEVLRAEGIDASPEEQRLHNMIRAPQSIRERADLQGIEAWLLKLVALHDNVEATQVIASQWVRACIRAAPLGMSMLQTYRASPLRTFARAGATTMMDLTALAAMKLDYRSAPFAALRRLGLSA